MLHGSEGNFLERGTQMYVKRPDRDEALPS